MLTRTIRTLTSASLFCALLTLWPSTQALAQTQSPTQSPKSDETYIAVVTGDDVYVRSGPSDSYYPFTKLSSGALVQVMGEKILDEKSRWARVATSGAAFREAYGYIKIAKADAGKFRVSDDGRSGMTLGRVDVIAPNLDVKGSAKDSWKPLVRLDTDQAVQILETTATDKDTIYKVTLPDSAQGWVALSFVRKATDTETAQFKASLTGAKPGTLAEGPKIAPTKPSDITHGAAPKPTEPLPSAPKPEVTKPVADNSETPSLPPTITDQPNPTGENQSAESADANHTTIKPATPTTRPITPPHDPTLDELEGRYKLLQKEPIETAEVNPLRELYLGLGKRNPSDKRIVRYVAARTDQLQVWSDLQKKQQELAEIRGRLNSTSADAEIVRKALESSEQYTAVGKIAASTLYDGEGLPKLLRLQDAATGRTVAYLQPDEKYELANLIGILVGVVGDKSYDGSLRLNIISPRRIDVLSTDKDKTQAVTAETPTKP